MVIRLINITKHYRVGDEQIRALDGVWLEVDRNEYVAIMGTSGSGKSTLMNILGCLDRPTSGTYELDGRLTTRMSAAQLAQVRNERIGFVFQSFGLLPTLSAYENVDLMLRLIEVTSTERRQRTLECLELVGLAKWMHHRPHEMSGGQQQRVGIARALANHPRLLLADEPTGELDSNTSREILQLFRDIVEVEHITVLMTSHDPLVDKYADEIVLLKDGQIFTPIAV